MKQIGHPIKWMQLASSCDATMVIGWAFLIETHNGGVFQPLN